MKRNLETAYFAGLIDGEGTIGAYPKKGRRSLRPCIKLNMTCKKTVDAVANHFGGSVLVKKIYPDKFRKPQWFWGADCTKALVIIKQLRPYLITKADAADFVLKNCEEGKRRRVHQ